MFFADENTDIKQGDTLLFVISDLKNNDLITAAAVVHVRDIPKVRQFTYFCYTGKNKDGQGKINNKFAEETEEFEKEFGTTKFTAGDTFNKKVNGKMKKCIVKEFFQFSSISSFITIIDGWASIVRSKEILNTKSYQSTDDNCRISAEVMKYQWTITLNSQIIFEPTVAFLTSMKFGKTNVNFYRKMNDGLYISLDGSDKLFWGDDGPRSIIDAQPQSMNLKI